MTYGGETSSRVIKILSHANLLWIQRKVSLTGKFGMEHRWIWVLIFPVFVFFLCVYLSVCQGICQSRTHLEFFKHISCVEEDRLSWNTVLSLGICSIKAMFIEQPYMSARIGRQFSVFKAYGGLKCKHHSEESSFQYRCEEVWNCLWRESRNYRLPMSFVSIFSSKGKL